MEAVTANISSITLHDPVVAKEGDSAWVMVSAAMVLLMAPGLAFFYGGLVKDTTIVNTMMMSVIAMGVISILWALVGFSLAFGNGGPFIGNFDYVGFQQLDDELWGDTTIWSFVFATFQMTFAIIAAAIMSGSLVERVRFSAYVCFISLWHLLVYVPLCHWVWGAQGWILEMGALDFAGGTVVHISSGVSGLVASALLGPRQHLEREAKPFNVPFVLLGGGLLWFGWIGFNAGSALAADAVAARAIATTCLAAAAAMLSMIFMVRLQTQTATSSAAMVGAVSGLVVITPAAGFVSPLGAIAMGVVASPVCFLAVTLLNKVERLDDALDAFGLHGVGGLLGAVLTGVFALDGGLFCGGGWALLGTQIACSVACMAYSATMTAVIFFALRLVMRVRVHQEQEQWLDKHAHGEEAYRGRPAKVGCEPPHGTAAGGQPSMDTASEDCAASTSDSA